MDPGKSTPAVIRYEIRLQSGPCTFRIRGVEHVIDGGDALVLVRRCLQGSFVMDERIVGVIGDDWEYGSTETVRLVSFMDAGGVIGLSRDLDAPASTGRNHHVEP